MSKYLNRDISWLSFNERVLDETKKNIPLAEKVMFLGIVSSNLDEFLQVRYPTALATMEPKLSDKFQKKLKAHMVKVIQQTDKFLEKHKIIRKIKDLDKDTQKDLDRYFKANVYPTIQAITVRKSKQLNPIAGLYLLVITKDSNDEEKVNYIELPRSIPRFIPVKNKNYVITLEDLITSNLKYIFHDRKIVDSCAFSIIRSADVYVQSDDYADPFDLISRTLHERNRAWITRVEITSRQKKLIKIIKDILPLSDDTMLVSDGSIMMSDLKKIDSSIYTEEDAARKFTPYDTFPSGSIFKYIKSEDRLAFHPYESFQSTVVRFIEEAASDPTVVSIKISLYRVSDHSKIIDALLKAADRGKLVTVLVELKARFDEHHNIEISKILEEGGVRLVYTKPNIKTHAKVCLVTRKEKGKIRIYSHIGTGNYSEGNGKLYTDYSYFTANQDVGFDLSRFFNILTSDQGAFKSKHIIYAPHNMRETIVELIDNEINKAKKKKNARIICKCNALTDEKIADKLVLAAKEGVKVVLIIRGACILEPRKNLHIYSIVGRWLEHSRILAFGVGKQTEIYIGSSDLMYRNLSLRNELIIHVENDDIKTRILGHIKMYLNDNVNRREIKSDYNYEEIQPGKKDKKFNSQEEMAKEAKKLAL